MRYPAVAVVGNSVYLFGGLQSGGEYTGTFTRAIQRVNLPPGDRRCSDGCRRPTRTRWRRYVTARCSSSADGLRGSSNAILRSTPRPAPCRGPARYLNMSQTARRPSVTPPYLFGGFNGGPLTSTASYASAAGTSAWLAISPRSAAAAANWCTRRPRPGGGGAQKILDRLEQRIVVGRGGQPSTAPCCRPCAIVPMCPPEASRVHVRRPRSFGVRARRVRCLHGDGPMSARVPVVVATDKSPDQLRLRASSLTATVVPPAKRRTA